MQTGAFDPVRTLLLCVAATAIIGWLNLRCGRCRRQQGVRPLGTRQQPPPCCRAAGAGKPLQRMRLKECVVDESVAPAGAARSNDVFDGATGVDRSKPESVVNLLGGNVRLVFGLATLLLAGGVGLLFWLLQSAVRPRPGAKWTVGGWAGACGHVSLEAAAVPLPCLPPSLPPPLCQCPLCT